MPPPAVAHVVVVGGGIAGLAAAEHLGRTPGVSVTVLEATGRVGGKLAVSDLAGLPVDEGAESFLARRPEALDLVRAAGLGDAVVHPAVTGASVWSRGAVRPLPPRQVMGVPGDLRTLARSRVLGPVGLLRATLDRALPRTPLSGDVSVGALVARRLGREVADRLVEPLLGGVYAGRADLLSAAATVPALLASARRHRSLVRAAAEVADGAAGAGPLFGSVAGGLGRLPEALARGCGAQIRTRTTVRELRRTPGGWELVVGPTRGPEVVCADAVVLAVPAAPAARLLASVVPSAANDLAAVEYASVALVSLAYPRAALPPGLAGTGLLVPPVEGRAVKAVTYSSRKWGWLQAADPRLAVVRASLGRLGEEAVLQRDDADLVALTTAELATLTGVRGDPVAVRVSRWGGALPQYAVGHLDRVARVRAAVAEIPGLAVCGAAYDGVGIPACVASARSAATSVLRSTAGRGEWPHG